MGSTLKTAPKLTRDVPDTHGITAGHICAARHAGIEESGTLKIAISSVPHGAHGNLKGHGKGGEREAIVIPFAR